MSISRLSTAYNAWSSRSPLVSQTIVATVTTAAADVIIQRPTSWDDLNLRRTLGFGIFGLTYMGLAQYAIYVYGYQKVFCSKTINRFCDAPWKDKFKDREGLRMLGKQMGLDFFVVQPIIFWPSYYISREWIQDGTLNVKKSLGEYKKTGLEDNIGMCGFWFPADVIIYSLPIHLRMHASHVVSFGFSGGLSHFRGEKECRHTDDPSQQARS